MFALLRLFLFAGALFLSVLIADATTYRNESFGFQLEIPDGWAVAEVANTGTTLHVTFTPEDLESVQLAVRVYPESTVGGPEAVRQLAIDSVDGDDKYSNAKTGNAVVGGDETMLAFQVDTRSDSGSLRVHQRYLTRYGRTYVLQSVARPTSFKKLSRRFDRIWSSFEELEPSAEEAEKNALLALAARCGSQIDWATTWKEAARRAREENKLVLVTAWIYRGFNLTDATMGSVFTDPDVVELVNERYVPYRLTLELDVPFADPDVYGMGPFTFGSAAMLVTPEGEVLDEVRVASYGFLARGLLEGAKGPERFTLELEAGLAELATREGTQAHRLRAGLYRRHYHAQEALAELRAAREEAEDETLRSELRIDEAQLLFRVGEIRAGVELLEAFVEEHPEHERRPEALFRLGDGQLHLGGSALAEGSWNRLIEARPDSPWAWRAAARMTSTAYELGWYGRLDWPAPEVVTQLVAPNYEPLPFEEARRAEDDAAAWLLAHQREDGSWLTPTELARPLGSPAEDFKLAITAICTQALLERRTEESVARAIEHALDWLVPAYEGSFESGGEAFFMDYGVWSRAFVLLCLAQCVEAELRTVDAVKGHVAHMVEELSAKQMPGGGWSYYLKNDLGSDTTSNRSISFTTAAVVLALQHAEQTGFEVPGELLEGGLDALEAMRSGRGQYDYFDGGTGGRGGGPGAAGRGPVCALVLYQGGRVELDELRGALDFFVEHRRGLDKERGKVLMHTGADGQGSHYLMFDYAMTALALSRMPERERKKYVEPLLEVLLNARCEGGAFVDNTGRGIAYGTGMALIALRLMRE